MKKYFNRELSWLSFNERVLQEALDSTNPIVERIRFLGIYSNNMDEFFRVRVAYINRMISFDAKKVTGLKGGPKALLNEVLKTVEKQTKIFELAYHKILKEMENHNVIHVNETTAPDAFKEYLSTYYHDILKQDIVPIILSKKNEFPRLKDKEIYLAIRMFDEKANKSKYALIEVPSHHNRFLTFAQDGKNYVILLDDVIRLFMHQIFGIFSFDKIEAHTFKFTRNAELNIDDDISVSMYDKIEEGIQRRKRGEPLRFVYDEEMHPNVLALLKKSLGIADFDHVAPGGRYHNIKDFMKFPDFGQEEFGFKSLAPLNHKVFAGELSLIQQVLKKDVLLHYPYHKFDHLVDLLREAAIDPKVMEIKITVYRVSKHSQILNALVNALKNGKMVTAVFELQARFDEENNMAWSNKMRESGAKIIYGVPGLKVHAKLIQITRKSGKEKEHIVHIGTGNFNGSTAKVYTDFSLLTSNPLITREIVKVFNLLENNIERAQYRQLFVAPFNSRRRINSLVNTEIRNAKKGNPAGIDLKLNNLVDIRMINKLYEASKAGVKIRLLVRGICCLKPGVEGLSENIQVISIVGRFLEHARFLVFHNDGNPLYYLTSADWMTRNFDKRIEITAPILDEEIQEEIKQVFEKQWNTIGKAREVDVDQRNRYVKRDEGAKHSSIHNDLYDWYAGKLEE